MMTLSDVVTKIVLIKKNSTSKGFTFEIAHCLYYLSAQSGIGRGLSDYFTLCRAYQFWKKYGYKTRTYFALFVAFWCKQPHISVASFSMVVCNTHVDRVGIFNNITIFNTVK